MIDMTKWKEYPDILTDSLWLFDKRNDEGLHKNGGKYHGNFIPQIPYQLFSRYTDIGDTILDPFMGGGTSLIEAHNMGRKSIGIELQESVANEVKEKLNSYDDIIIYNGDSREVDINKQVQFIIYHPPYWDIIKFSDNDKCLSNCATIDTFLSDFDTIIDNTAKYLEKNKYLAVVIGDKYQNKQVIPLGFYCMNLFMQKGFLLKATIVKNFGETQGKKNQQAIWRYRALKNDFYIFKHEYIFIFKKVN